MPALRKGSPSVEDKVRAELALIRTQVPGVRGSLAATSDRGAHAPEHARSGHRITAWAPRWRAAPERVA